MPRFDFVADRARLGDAVDGCDFVSDGRLRGGSFLFKPMPAVFCYVFLSFSAPFLWDWA